MKDPSTEPKRGRIEGRRRGWVRQGKVVVGKWRELYLNIIKEITKKNRSSSTPKYKNQIFTMVVMLNIILSTLHIFLI